jgi:hypothetical protein
MHDRPTGDKAMPEASTSNNVGWGADELDRIGAADELKLASRRPMARCGCM